MSASMWVKSEGDTHARKSQVKEEVDVKPCSNSAIRTRAQNVSADLRATGKRQFSITNKRMVSKTVRIHRSSRATARQVQGLIDIMAVDQELANGHVLSEQGRREMMNRWVAIAKKLNYENYGPPKTVMQWQKMWRELKRRTRNCLTAQQVALLESRPVKPLTLSEDRVAKIIEDKVQAIAKTEKPISATDEERPLRAVGPQHLSYVNCDDSAGGDESQLESFPGWSEAPPSPLPARKIKTTAQRTEMSNNPGGIHSNGSHLEEAQDPFACTSHQIDAFSQFMERLIQLEKSRQTADARREEHRVWCDQKFVELEERRLKLEQRRLDLEEHRLQQDRRRSEMDEAMYASWREFLSKK